MYIYKAARSFDYTRELTLTRSKKEKKSIKQLLCVLMCFSSFVCLFFWNFASSSFCLNRKSPPEKINTKKVSHIFGFMLNYFASLSYNWYRRFDCNKNIKIPLIGYEISAMKRRKGGKGMKAPSTTFLSFLKKNIIRVRCGGGIGSLVGDYTLTCEKKIHNRTLMTSSSVSSRRKKRRNEQEKQRLIFV